MQVLLTCVGALIVAGIGWAIGRAGRPQADSPAPAPAPPDRLEFADLVDDYPVGLVVVDPLDRVVYRNAAARVLQGTHVGVLLDEAVDRHARNAGSGATGDEVLEMYGPPRTVLVVRASPLPDGGAMVFVQDVSERRRVEQVRTDFVANLSHELKTPVGAMAVLAETLEGESDPETIARVVDRLMKEADRASRTIDDLLELSQIELGGEQVVERVAVAHIVDGAIERVTELAAQTGIRLSTLGPVDAAGAPRESIFVDGDRRQLVSAVGNLVENAVKYSEPGGTVQVRVRRIDDAVEIAVSDQGVGIPQRDLGRIFERFYRVDRARSRVTGGTGLGLSIVRHVASSHQGDVTVTSTEGEGSVFVLRLPIGRSEPEQAGTDPGRPTDNIEGVA